MSEKLKNQNFGLRTPAVDLFGPVSFWIRALILHQFSWPTLLTVVFLSSGYRIPFPLPLSWFLSLFGFCIFYLVFFLAFMTRPFSATTWVITDGNISWVGRVVNDTTALSVVQSRSETNDAGLFGLFSGFSSNLRSLLRSPIKSFLLKISDKLIPPGLITDQTTPLYQWIIDQTLPLAYPVCSLTKFQTIRFVLSFSDNPYFDQRSCHLWKYTMFDQGHVCVRMISSSDPFP